MALLEKHLFVKKSTIPNAGKGLFTKIFIPKGTRIVEYKGRRTIWKDVKDDHENGYLYTINNNNVIDAGKTLSALARYANDAKGLTRVKGVVNNSQYVVGSGELQKMDSITRFYATDIANMKTLHKDSVKKVQKDRRVQNYQIRNKKGQ